MAKNNAGSLVENIEKPPYKTLFNSKTTSFLLLNSVKTFREIDKILKSKEIGTQGREHLALVHGNRFILHMAYYVMKKDLDFESSKIDGETLKKASKNACEIIIPLHYEMMNKLLSDAYPANIFKNLGRTREIREAMIAELS